MTKKIIFRVLLVLFAFVAQMTWAQAPVATPEAAITGLLNRIGGNGAADKFEIVIDANLAENGKDVFVIASQNGKPCIKGNTQLSVATGINWYLNHYAHINLTWNNLTTDLSQVTLPVPGTEEKHVCNTTYRYNFNTCTFSYSMAFWTWERWQQEIDWMALHGINAPLNLVGLDVVTRKFLRELGVSEDDINAYIAGPGFIAWFAMNNLEGWGGTINATDVTMNGNPDWWYTRQEQLCRNMLQRMRELGMQPVIPGFSGQVPNCIVDYSINGFNSGDVVNNGTWAGGYTRPDILKPNTESYRTFAAVYYKHLHEVMGVSELYSIDPFHEGSLPSGVTNATCYPNIMVELDNYYNGVSQDDKTKNNVDEQPKWIIQYWQGVPQSGAFSAMSSYGDRFIGLDLFSDAPGKAKWNTDYFQSRPYIFCMLHNFGGRSGMHGRLESTMNDYFSALAKGNNCQGIGATPEGTETNPILYDMLFELPWMSSKPNVDEWLADYAYARYGVQNDKALTALQNLKKSVWACPTDQQGTSEAVILARPNWTVNSVSSWSTSAIYWDTQDVLVAADELSQISDLITTADGTANYNYDFIDVVRQAMVDYAAELLPLINAAKNNDAEYTRLYQLYLQLMLDLDEMLSYDENFKLERWTSLARNIANEVSGTTENDRKWLEWNARTQVTVWSKGDTDLHDYSNRCWAGLIKDFHYKRWEKFFTSKGGSFSGGWFSGFEYPWTVDFTNYNYSTVTIPNDMTATAKAKQTFGNYFGRVVGQEKNYLFPMGITTNATKSDVVPEIYRGNTVALPLEIRKTVTINSVWIDLNNDGAASNNEKLEVVDGNKVTIPADATIGKTTAQVVYSDGTDITFSLALVEDITENRTVTAVAGANGSVAIEGADVLTVTNKEAVKMTATANAGYNFANWTDANSNVVSNDNPFIYYGKEAATFTANFIQDKWGVVECAPDKDGAGNVKDETAVMGDINSNNQYIHNLTLSYYNREAETIYEPTAAPTSIFTTVPQIVNVPQGASFTVEYDKGISNGFQHCYFRAYIDLNVDGDFDDEGELLKEVGTRGAQNTAVCSNKINVLLPYDMPLGITHMRLRFDSAWNIGDDAKSQSVRPVYELIINVTEKSDKAATINVESNNNDWGTVKVWTDETPDGSTRTEWEVTKGVEFFIAAEKASEDVEFLGWYDHYGRLLTENLEHTMYAREDATYTAKFRKALDIDGWEFEYRTEPGEDVVTNKLANGVKPEAGKTYYIYAPTRPDNAGEYVNRYLYNNSGTLTLSTTESTAASYLWVCGVEDGKYTFQNVADPTKYLMHKGLSNSSYGFELGTGTTYYEGLTLQSVPGNGESRNLFFVINDDGSGFNQSTRAHNQSTEDYTTDFVFTEVTYPDVVILTSVRQSGNNDLVIPETVEILGEQCKIVGFDNNLFKNNKDLWSITMPSSMEFLSDNTLFETSVKGENTPTASGDDNPDAKVQVINLGGLVLKNNESWKVVAEYESDGVSTYNQWGTPLLYASGDGTGTELFYLSSTNNWSTCWHVRSPFSGLSNDFFKAHTDGKFSKFTAVLENKGTGKAVITVINSEGEAQTSSEVSFTYDNISAFSARLPKGVNITKFMIQRTAEVNPFSGCSNLSTIAFSGTCANYYVAQDGDLYNSSDVLICSPEAKTKADDIRNLGTLIDNTKELMDVIAASVDPVGKANGLSLTTQGQDFYVSSNADQNTGGGSNDGGGIAALVDNNEGTFFHTRWGGTVVNEPHYIQVDLGANNLMNNFKFTYKPRNGSPAPTAMTVYGSNDDTNFTDVLATINSGLPAHNSGNTYESAVIDSKHYRYLRFTVTGSAGPGNAQYGGQYFFGMLEFDLFKLTSTVEVNAEYKDIAKITNEEAENVYDNMVNALYVYNNGGTAAELQAAYDVLKPLYDAVNDKKNSLQYINDLNELVENTDALINKIATSVDPVGKATEIALQSTTSGDAYYIWCSNPHTGDNADARGGVAALLDEDPATYLHTNWSSVSSTHDYLQIDNVNPVDLVNFKIAGQQRADGGYDRPKNIEIYGSNDNTIWTPITSVTGLPNSQGATWASEALTSGAKYAHYKFVVKTYDNENNVGRPYFHMAKFDLFKLTSVVEVDPGYKTLGGITNENATAAYDLMVQAQYLCNNGGTTAELEATLTALQTAYDALNAKQGKVLNGYYNISWQNGETEVPMFIGYNEENDDWVGEDHKGYKMLGTGVYTTDNEADKVFHIVPQENGYSISAQGKNLVAINFNGWNHLQFADDKNAAGVYNFIEQTDLENVYKIQGVGEDDGDGTHNDFLQVYNTDGKMIVGPNPQNVAHNFKLVPVTEYTLTVPAGGVTTLCLPFNVVLPQGVTAYDLAEGDLTSYDNCTGYTLSEVSKVAVGGETLAKNTPVIIKATAADYTLTITMDEEGAKGSKDGSVLRSAVVKTTLTAAETKYTFDGENFNVVGTDTEVAANQCWMELDANCGQKIFTTEYAFPTVLIPTDKSRDQLLSNITWGSTIGTFSAPYPTVIPAGVTAYYATQEYNGGVVSLTPVGENLALPANQGVILIGESDKTNLLFVPAAGETVADLSSNTMSNSAATSVVMGNSDYILANDKQGIGIYQATPGSTLKQGKAFFRLPAAQGVNSLVLNFGGSATGIENAQIQLLDGDAVYDIYGRRVTHINKGGIYIKNGKKFIVK